MVQNNTTSHCSIARILAEMSFSVFMVTSIPVALISPVASEILTDAGIAITFTLSASVLWLQGASQAFYHVRIGGFMILLLMTWSLIFPASHFLLPHISATAPHRVPGMASGLMVAALALLTLRFVFINYPHQGVSHET